VETEQRITFAPVAMGLRHMEQTKAGVVVINRILYHADQGVDHPGFRSSSRWKRSSTDVVWPTSPPGQKESPAREGDTPKPGLEGNRAGSLFCCSTASLS
jgi:hypothetical protein